jgi:hypothetical protein
MVKSKQIKSPVVPAVNCRNKTEEQCKAIAETLKESYAKGRRYRKVGFTKEGKAK